MKDINEIIKDKGIAPSTYAWGTRECLNGVILCLLEGPKIEISDRNILLNYNVGIQIRDKTRGTLSDILKVGTLFQTTADRIQFVWDKDLEVFIHCSVAGCITQQADEVHKHIFGHLPGIIDNTTRLSKEWKPLERFYAANRALAITSVRGKHAKK